jgi:polysaccharide pyruvyl transferase WcaK-like protein
MEYVKRMGIATNGDRVYPDLAFSLPEADMPHDESPKRHRRVIGVGVMHHSSMYGPEGPSDAMYLAYLDKLVVLVQWLLTHEYDVRLLIGDKSDTFVTEKFVSLLRERLPAGYEGRIFNEPVDSVEQLVSQLAATDIVVATRFHNVLLALLLNKPVISISFHSKCSSLMSSIGLSEYCHDINHLSAGELIQQFCDIEKDAAKLELFIRQRTEEFRRELDEQYGAIFKEGLREPCDGRRSPRDLPPAIGFHEGI